ncbi:MAG: zinc ABC transporter substrate-binding protein [Chloroflexi bacterium]|nr:zinc ABC transporter substrate-binding protein [Chloroflexota bacterium]
MKNKKESIQIIILLISFVLLTACSQQNEQALGADKLKVVATTTIVGDVVAQVGGDLIELGVLLPAGTDPHGFDPAPRDITKVAEADVIFASGAGLEYFLDKLIESAGAEAKVVYVSEEIDFLVYEPESEEDDQHDGEGPGHESVDPHTWTDPNNVIIWTHNIEAEISQLDPINAEAYAANAESFRTELIALDAWIRQQVEQVSLEKRKFVTDHTLFSYFAEEYGFEQVGTLIPGYSTLAEPTAQELAKIEDAIYDLDVQAVFVGNTVNPSLAERVAEDTGVQLIYVFTGSLSEAGGQADSYLDYMRYNTNAFVNALK